MFYKHDIYNNVRINIRNIQLLASNKNVQAIIIGVQTNKSDTANIRHLEIMTYLLDSLAALLL